VSRSSINKPETCPLLLTANIISGKWTLVILRDVANGINRFSTLERSLGGISPKTLYDALKGLQKAGVLTRSSYPEVPPRVEYTLTAKGQALIPLIEQMSDYGATWLCGGDPTLGELSDGIDQGG
jgi:DNA-binding HxlR family transcriptional regulator